MPWPPPRTPSVNVCGTNDAKDSNSTSDGRTMMAEAVAKGNNGGGGVLFL